MNLDAGLDLLMWCFPGKKDTLHKLITTSPSLREMPGIQYVVLMSVSGVYNLGWATNYHVPTHSNLVLLLQDGVFWIAVT